MFPIFQLIKKKQQNRFVHLFWGGLSIVSGWPWRPMHRPKCLLELQRAAYPTNAPWKFRVELLNPNWSDRNCLFEGNFFLRSVFRDDWCMVSYWLPEIDLMTVFHIGTIGLIFSQTCSLTNWHCLTSLKYEGGNWQFQESCDTRSGTTKSEYFHTSNSIMRSTGFPRTRPDCHNYVVREVFDFQFIGPKSDLQVLKLSKGFWHEFNTILQRCQDFFSHGLIISCQNTFRKWMQTCFAGRIETSFPKGPWMIHIYILCTRVYIYIHNQFIFGSVEIANAGKHTT